MALNATLSDSPIVWKQHQQLIRDLYEGKDGDARHNLTEVKKILMTEHGFPDLPLSIYEKRLRNHLGLRKKMASNDWRLIWPYCQDIIATGHTPEVNFHGTKIPWVKAWKEIRRSGAHKSLKGSDRVVLPTDISISIGPSTKLPKRAALKTRPHQTEGRQVRFCETPLVFTASPSPSSPPFQSDDRSPEANKADPKKQCMLLASEDGKTSDSETATQSWEEDWMSSKAMAPTPWLQAAIFSLSCPWNEKESLEDYSRDGRLYSMHIPRSLSIVTMCGFGALDPSSIHFSPPGWNTQTTYTMPWEFSIFHSIAEATFRFSNNLVQFTEPSRKDRDLYTFLLKQVPETLLLAYLGGSLPSIKSTLLSLIEFTIFRGDMHHLKVLMRAKAVAIPKLQRHAVSALVRADRPRDLCSFLQQINATTYALSTVAQALRQAIIREHHACYHPLLRWLRAAAKRANSLAVHRELRRFQCMSDGSLDWDPYLVIAFRSSQLSQGVVATPILSIQHPLSYHRDEACFQAYKALGDLGRDFLVAMAGPKLPWVWWPCAHEQSIRLRTSEISRSLGVRRADWKFFVNFLYNRTRSIGDGPAQPDVYLGAIVCSAYARNDHQLQGEIDTIEVFGRVCIMTNIIVHFVHCFGAISSIMQCIEKLVAAGLSFTEEAFALAAALGGKKLLVPLRRFADVSSKLLLAAAVAARKNDLHLLHWLREEGVSMSGWFDMAAYQQVNSKSRKVPLPTVAYIAACVSDIHLDDKSRLFMDGKFPKRVASLNTVLELHRKYEAPIRRNATDPNSYGFLEDLFMVSPETRNNIIVKIGSLLDQQTLNKLGIPFMIGIHSKTKVIKVPFKWIDPAPTSPQLCCMCDPVLEDLPTAILCGAPPGIIKPRIEAALGNGTCSLFQRYLQDATYVFNLAAMQLFESFGVSLHERHRCDETLLHLACSSSAHSRVEAQQRLAVIQYLMEQGVDGNVPDKWGRTALTIAAEQGDVRIAILLLKARMDDSYPKALVTAARHGRLDMVHLLLDAKSAELQGNWSALDEAIKLAWKGQFYEVARSLQGFAGMSEEESDIESEVDSSDDEELEDDEVQML